MLSPQLNVLFPDRKSAKKVLTRSAQYLPKLLIDNRLIPSIKIGESFKYLGRFFDFDTSNKGHKSELIS